MKRLMLLFVPLLAMVSCQRDQIPGAGSRAPQGEIYHDMIQLGEKLEDPYTVENVTKAIESLYPTKGRVNIQATDLYVRFLPKDNDEMQILKDKGLYLIDHPIDYRIKREGDYYQDPAVGEEAITWQYSVVPYDFSFPEGIKYEVLDECYLAENDPTKAHSDIDWLAVEEEAFRLTGNEDLWAPPTKGGAVPSGRITIEDPEFSGGKPFGVAGVKVVCNIFVKFASCYTSRDGYYAMGKSFSGNPRYRLVFQNEKGFSIGFNWIIVPASVSTLGTGGPDGIDFNVNASSDNALFRRCAVNNAAYDYYSRCNETDLEIAPPPGDLRIWIFPGLTASSAPMLHHGAFLDNGLLTKYLGIWLGLIQIFLPDITIGTADNENYPAIYQLVSHELAHASHYSRVGNAFWSPYIQYIIYSFITQGGQAYGSGVGEGAGYCEVGEMWGYFMQASLIKDRYKGAMQTFGNSFWFKPDILTYLYERGMTRGEIFRALGASAVDVATLKDELVKVAPGLEKEIYETFARYDK